MSLATFVILLMAHLLDKLTSHKRPKLVEVLAPVISPFQQPRDLSQQPAKNLRLWFMLSGIMVICLALYPLLMLLPEWLQWPLQLIALVFTLSSYRLISRIRLLVEALDIARFDNNPRLAHKLLTRMSDRDCHRMNIQDMNAVAIESSWSWAISAWAAPIFWFLLADISGLLLYGFFREASLLWQKQHPLNIRPRSQPQRFIWQMHRLMLYPADLMIALAFIFYGKRRSLQHVLESGWKWPGPGGLTLAAGAGGMGIQLGGPIHIKGRMLMRPLLGPQNQAMPGDPLKALRWLRACWRLWMMVALISVILL